LKAGLQPWPRLWQNLRSSRETELSQQFPLHVVCQWIGSSQPVAAKHYLQVTDADYRRAVEPTGGYLGPVGDDVGCNLGREEGCKGWDTPISAASRHDNTTGRKPCDDEDLRPVVAGCGDYSRQDVVPPRGVEPLSSD
jgi:hypothetical protein